MEKENAKTKKYPLIILIVIIVLILAGVVIYGLIINKPKNIFLKNINNEYKSFSSLFTTDNSKIKTISTNTKFDFNINVGEILEDELTIENKELIEEINALSFDLNTNVDLEKKLLGFVLNLNYDEESLLNVESYGKPNSIYIFLENIYDKYIEVTYEEYEKLFEQETVNLENLEYVTSKVKDAFLNSLDEKYFVKTTEKISINGNEVKTDKITYVLNEQRTINMMISILREIKEDNKFLEILSTLSNKTVEEIKTEINNTIDECSDKVNSADTKTEVEISMYTKGIKNEAIKYSIKSEDIEISYSNYENTIKFIVKDNEETYVTITNVKNNEKSYNTEVVMDTVKITIVSKNESDVWTHDYKIVENESGMEISGSLVYSEKEVTKDKEYLEELKMTLKVNMVGMELIDAEINLTSTTKLNDEFVLPDVSNSILYSNMTEDDTNTMMTNILNNQTLIDFITKIMSLIDNGDNDEYYDDYEDLDYEFYYDYNYEEL